MKKLNPICNWIIFLLILFLHNYVFCQIEITGYTVYDDLFNDNNDGIVNPGESITIEIEVTNNTGIDLINVRAYADTTYDPYLEPYPSYDKMWYIGDIAAGASDVYWGDYLLISSYAPDGHVLTIPIIFRDDMDQVINTDTLHVTLQGTDQAAPFIDYYYIQDPYVPVGNSVQLTARIIEGSDNPTITAEIESPDETVVATITLYDDGTHGDYQAGDREFSGEYTPDIETDFYMDIHGTDEFGNSAGMEYGYVQFTSKSFVKTPDVKILLLQGYDGDRWSHERSPYYKSSLDTKNYNYDYYNSYFYGVISNTVLNEYEAVIWFGHRYREFDWDPVLQSYLDTGSNLWLSGARIAEAMGNNAFLNDYVHATYVSENVDLYGVTGMASDPISDNLDLILQGGDGYDQWGYDEIDPIAPAVAIYTYNASQSSSIPSSTNNEEYLKRMQLAKLEWEFSSGEIEKSEFMREHAFILSNSNHNQLDHRRDSDIPIIQQVIQSSGTAALRYENTYKLVY
jgi:hypothetical protein